MVDKTALVANMAHKFVLILFVPPELADFDKKSTSA